MVRNITPSPGSAYLLAHNSGPLAQPIVRLASPPSPPRGRGLARLQPSPPMGGRGQGEGGASPPARQASHPHTPHPEEGRQARLEGWGSRRKPAPSRRASRAPQDAGCWRDDSIRCHVIPAEAQLRAGISSTAPHGPIPQDTPHPEEGRKARLEGWGSPRKPVRFETLRSLRRAGRRGDRPDPTISLPLAEGPRVKPEDDESRYPVMVGLDPTISLPLAQGPRVKPEDDDSGYPVMVGLDPTISLPLAEGPRVKPEDDGITGSAQA